MSEVNEKLLFEGAEKDSENLLVGILFSQVQYLLNGSLDSEAES